MKTINLILALIIISSTAVYSQWTQTTTPDGGGITDMVVLNDGTLIATTSSFNYPAVQGGIKRSTNNGALCRM
jgi:hypothetical protein